jgi:predicted DsbA family dithiol-disulfide isomerase
VLLLAIVALPACANKAEEQAPGSEVVATINGEPITLTEVEEKAAGGLKKIEQERYDLLRQTLEGLAAEKMLAIEAESRGVTTDDVVAAEIQNKITQPTMEEVTSFYQANKARIGERTLEEVGGQIQRFLMEQRVNERQEAFLAELKAKNSFELLLDVPRYEVPIPASEPSKGPVDAPVTVVEFADYQCPYCKRGHPEVARLLNEYGENIRYVFRDYPLEFHPRAVPAGIAARCAGDQGKYWEYHNDLMSADGDLGDADLKARAERVGIDMEAFDACRNSGSHDAVVQTAFADGQALGVTGTPSYFINGRMLVGAQPYQELKKIVDEELARAGRDKEDAGS